MMGSPNQPRDSHGRFARGGSADPRTDKERAKDAKRIDKARREAALSDLRDALATLQQEAATIKRNTPTRKDDPHDVVSWEQDRAANRDRIRRVRDKIAAVRAQR